MLICVITNMKIRRTYQLYFKRVFQLLFKCLQKQIHWKHIHGNEEGFKAVIFNIDGKQMASKIPRTQLERLPNIL
jgi:hypothetical protein